VATTACVASGIVRYAPLYVTPFIVSLVVTLVAVPIVRRIAAACAIYDRPDGGLKPHSRPIPYLGGVAMYLGWLTACLCGAALQPGLRDGLLLVAAAGTLLMLTGLIDDVRALSPAVRLVAQALAACLLLMGGIGTGIVEPSISPLFGASVPAWLAEGPLPLALGGLFCFLVIAGACNATNLIDGLDGLCAGVLGIAAIGFLLLSEQRPERLADAAWMMPACLATGFLGVCLAFLWYNFNPASIFMGDSGSLLLGFNAAVLLILLANGASWRGGIAGVGVFGVPSFDTALALARRWLNGRPLFVGDRSHFYDQLRDRGWSVRRTVLACYALGVVFLFAGVGIPSLSPFYIALVLAGGLLAAIAACFRLGLLRVDGAADRSRDEARSGRAATSQGANKNAEAGDGA